MTERELHEQASALFLEIRGRSEEDQRRILEETPVEERVRQEVASLLAFDLAPTRQATDEEAATSADGPARDEDSDLPGWIGPYRVIRRIGRGGSGLVLLAEQREPIRRKVAVKVVPYAAISPDLAARFEFERRALERAEHPNIARILDAGRTADGLPYLVMDFVEGETITEYCTHRNVPLKDRIGLILEVADAVQHAHQRGVIHRDLKPGNILITTVNGRPTPRVVDFGIARPIPEAFEVTAPPTSGLLMGTPAYMAPEQTGGQIVDTRADVYALGAVLYELICGRPPLEVRGDPLEVLRRIREETPPPPSRLLSAGGRRDVPRGLMADLDGVLTKAMEKDPARRYATATAFAEDLRRALCREPISARVPTLGYRAARFTQRHRGLVAASAAVAAALILGVVGLAWGLVEADRQRREAAAQSEAQAAINRFLTEDLLAAASPDRAGDKVTALDLLHRASRRVDARLGSRPLVAAAVHHALGQAYMELGAFDDASRHVEEALRLRRAHAGPEASDTVRSEIAAGSLLGRRQQFEEADRALTAAVARARRILGPDDPMLYVALNDLGTVYEGMDRGPEAVETLREALDGRKRLLGARDPAVLMTASNLAQAYDRVGDSDRALAMNLEALAVAEALDEPPRMALIGLCNNIGATYQDLSRDAEAAPYLRRAAAMAADWLGPENPDTLTIRANMASLEAELGDPDRGAEIYREIAEVRSRVLGPDAFDTFTAHYGRWNCLWIGKRFDEAAAGFAALLPRIEQALGEGHWLAVQTRVALARSLADGGREAEARPYAARAAAEFLRLYGPEHPRTRTAVTLAERLSADIEP